VQFPARAGGRRIQNIPVAGTMQMLVHATPEGANPPKRESLEHAFQPQALFKFLAFKLRLVTRVRVPQPSGSAAAAPTAALAIGTPTAASETVRFN
jgi:hypothetical protein